MDFQSWIMPIVGMASLYSFDILPDGSFSEIRLEAVGPQSQGMLLMNPNAPAFYPGIPYRNYWMDLNFESFVYKCGSTGQSLYSYVNARGVWLKGFYIPVIPTDEPPAEDNEKKTGVKTVYCLYNINYSHEVETDSMSQKSSAVASAVMELSIKLHESPDFYQAMAATAAEIRKFCAAEKCSLYTVDKNSQKCSFINEKGLQDDYLEAFAKEMDRTPFEVAVAWEKDLALSDCLLLEDLEVIRERDPAWYQSLVQNGIRNIILYAIRNNQLLVGYIWAANYDVDRKDHIKEILELSSFLLAAVISNHQMVSRLEVKSTIDGLTQVGNRNAMNEHLDNLTNGAEFPPKKMGIVFADLNGLKFVNDSEGHDAGDKLLSKAAALLRIAFGDYEIYRAGGDEFVVLCYDIEEEGLSRQVKQLRGLAENTGDVSFSIGTVHCTGLYNVKQAIKLADERMYEDKAAYYREHPERDRRRRR